VDTASAALLREIDAILLRLNKKAIAASARYLGVQNGRD